MATDTFDNRPGAFAHDRFRRRRRAWLRRVWWAFPLVAAFEIAVMAGLGLLLQPRHLAFCLGFGIGAAAAMVLVLIESPPHHIARWRQGAEGERATAKTLRGLTRRGWVLFNDIDTGRGNVDHVLVGPAGVFLLESKNLRGAVSVRGGVLEVKWHEDPDDGYENRGVARGVRRTADELTAALATAEATGPSVQPVVVIWGAFAQHSIRNGGVAWVSGRVLADVLAKRPTTLRGDAVGATAALLRAHLGGPSSRRWAPPK